MTAKSAYDAQRRNKRRRLDEAALGVVEHEKVRADASGGAAPVGAEEAQTALTSASTAIAPIGEPVLYGTAQFFEDCMHQTLVSTKHGLELAGSVLARQVGRRTLLVGLKRERSGQPGRVAIDPTWGEILWHTHPGVKGALAAFSSPDLDAARLSKRPLLVIGFGGLSPDVITTLALPAGFKWGWKGLLMTTGLKGLVALERYGKLKERLLKMGIAARVCYPSGHIEPVLRAKTTPMQAAIDDMSFAVDRSIGVIERTGQGLLQKLIKRIR